MSQLHLFDKPTTLAETIHQGRNIKRFRELFGIKQEAPATLGDDWNRKFVVRHFYSVTGSYF